MATKKTFFTLCLGLFIFLQLPSAATAATYYVSPTGDDNAAATIEAPVKTINKGLQKMIPGDTLIVESGTYNQVQISRSGTASAPMTIKGNNVKINGNGNAFNAISVFGSYIDISGFEVYNTSSDAVMIIGKNVTFRDFIVRDSTLLYQRDGKCTGTINIGRAAINVYFNSDNTHIQNGTIYHNCGEGIRVMANKNVTVSNVTIHDNWGTPIIIDNAAGVTIKNNHLYCTNDPNYNGNPGAGIEIVSKPYGSFGNQLSNLNITNNIIAGCRGIIHKPTEVGVGGISGALIAHNTLYNLTGDQGIHIHDQPNNLNIRLLNNLYSGTITNTAYVDNAKNLQTTNFETTPVISNPLSFTPQSGSTAIDQGIPTSITTDFSGNTRPHGAAADIGAIERGSSVNPALSPSPIPKPGDLNGDGIVNLFDFNHLINNFGNPYTILDFAAILNNYNN